MRRNLVLWAAIVLNLLLTLAARADEGMWLLNRPPLQQLRATYGFEPAPQLLENAQKSAVKFGGGSGSLVSADGLVLTNHHVGSGALAKLSTPEHDLLKTGFYAPTKDAELKCPDTELRILWSITDVTTQVNAAVKPDMSPADANTARRKAMVAIEKKAEDESHLDGRVVTLYGGARYHLYQSRRYTDVRLVFAPEQQAAFFGGDNDNFEFPRFDLDMCIFRIYDNVQPLHAEHFLKWGKGSAEGDLAFVIGHPGHTQRLNTVDHLKFIRDVEVPTRLANAWRRQSELQVFSARSDENDRIATGELFGVQNGRKLRVGMLSALQDPEFIGLKLSAEQKLRAFVDQDAKRRSDWAAAWPVLSSALHEETKHQLRSQAIYHVTGAGKLLDIASDLVQLADESLKPDVDRLPEFSDARRKSLTLGLFSPAPIYDALEIDQLTSGLSAAAGLLGADDPLVQLALAGKAPRQRAEGLVSGTKLKDVEFRRKLADGGKAAIDASDDPMIRYAALLDPTARADRKRREDGLEAIERSSYAKIAAATFAAGGEDVYPDATGTLRLAFGTIKGYEESSHAVPAFTQIGGLFARSQERYNRRPFDLPAKWADAESTLEKTTPFNFVLTADIIGGNSGSPVINRAGELIGLIFDGNLQSLGSDFQYDDRQGRAVAVDARAIIEALKKVYHADALVSELAP